MERIIINYEGRNVKVGVVSAGFFRKGLGLMFRTRNTDNLLFEFGGNVRRGLTSWFVFFDFLVLWLDEKNRVIDKKIVKPFEFYIGIKCKFRRIVEVPINRNNKEILGFFVGK